MDEKEKKVIEVTIDGNKVPVPVQDICTFKDLLSYIESELVIFPKVLTRVILNEEELDESQEIGLGAFKLEDILSLELHTQDRLDLAHEALEDSQIYLPELSAVLEDAARIIREGNINDGVMAASQALEYISAFGQILEGLRSNFQMDFSQVRIDDFTLLDKLLELNSYAGKILKAVEGQDWTMFADLIEYEVSPLLYQWMAVVPELIKLLPEPSQEAGGGENRL